MEGHEDELQHSARSATDKAGLEAKASQDVRDDTGRGLSIVCNAETRPQRTD